MNSADLAIIAVAAVSLADGYWHHRFRMGVADRVRVVNPVKQPQPQDRETGAAEAPQAATETPKIGPASLGNVA